MFFDHISLRFFPSFLILSCLLGSGIHAMSAETPDSPVRWTHWRGDAHDGVSAEKNLPTTWNEQTGENILWVKEIPQWGTNTPVIWGEKLFFTAQNADDELLLLCLNRLTGEEIWRRTVGKETFQKGDLDYGGKVGESRKKQQFHEEQNMASPSCATDGEIVVTHFGNGDLAVFDLDGKQLWKTNMQEQFGDFTIWWGHANSPVIFEDFVIVPAIQDPCMGVGEKDTDSYIVAYKKRTGEIAWRTLRNTGVDNEPSDAYIFTPIQTINGQPQLLAIGGLCADAYDPRTGERIWWYTDLIGNRAISSPAFAGDLGIFIQGHQRGVVALPLTKKGKLTEADMAWTVERNCPDCTIPVYYNGLLFMVNNNGIAQCLEAKTGDVLWTKRLRDLHRASPVVADGNVYFTNTKGQTVVLRADADGEEVGECQVDDSTYASLVIVDGKIYLRGRTKMYCIGKKV